MGAKRLSLGIILGLSAVFGVLCFAHRWLCDDGFIDLHVADNLLSGLGPVFNAGERVEAYTSPLWVAALVVLGAITKPFSGAAGPAPFEWISVGLGVACSIGAFAAAGFGSLRLAASPLGPLKHSEWRPAPVPATGGLPPVANAGPTCPFATTPPIPLGALLPLGIVAFWDFGTSGLEASLVLLWLGLSFAALVRLRDRPTRRLELLTSVWIGLGPLVRPDLGIFALLFAALLLSLVPTWKRRAVALLAVVFLPAAYELFRMGYFACLVPNTALAKEAGHTAWRRGWLYFLDFEVTYQLWIPLAVLAAAQVALLRRLCFQAGKSRDTRSCALAAAPILGGLLHGLYIVRVGGDFLHARMLLPALFAIALPVFMVPGPRAWRFGSMLIPWALGCALFAHIADDREHINLEAGRPDYVQMSGLANPVTADDHRQLAWATADKLFRDIDRDRANAPPGTGFFSATMNVPLRAAALEPWSPARVEAVSYRAAIGIFGYQARQRVYVCDQYGLADPFVARAEMLGDGPRGKAGHEKGLSTDWCLARTVSALEGHDRYSPAVEYLRNALACGDLAQLNAAVIEPLTWRRFWRNVALAPRLTLLHVPHDPLEARKRFCGSG